MHNVLGTIEKGMKVYDSARHHIGVVDWVKLSDADADYPLSETADISLVERMQQDEMFGNVVDLFRADELPDEIHDKLLREGFVHLDADGVFSADRYVLPDQIQSVAGNDVTLKVAKSDLIKEP